MEPNSCRCGASSSWACQICGPEDLVDWEMVMGEPSSNHAERRPWPSRAELPAQAFVMTFTPAELAALDRLTMFFGLAMAGELGRNQAESDAMCSAMLRIRESIHPRARR